MRFAELLGPAWNRDEVLRRVSENMRRNLPQAPFGKFRGSVNICGNGPSLRRKYPKLGPIAALNNSWRTLVNHGIMPDYIVCHDPSEHNVEFFANAPYGPIYLLASRVDPLCFDLLKDHDVRIWHVNDGPEAELELPDRIDFSCTIGTSAMNLMAGLGYRHLDLWGYDSCFDVDGAHHSTQQDWALSAPTIINIGERAFASSPWMIAQVQEGLKQIESNRFDYTVDIHDGGLFQAALEEATLEVLYDLNTAPGSWDFLTSMLNAENYRKDHNFCRIRVNFKSGSNNGFRPQDPIWVSHENKTRMLNHVARPLLKNFGYEEVAEVKNPMKFVYSPRFAVDHFRETGEHATYQASFSATEWAERNYDFRFVTITLREADYWPQRNSNLEEWIEFANSIDDRVIFVRDTAKAKEEIQNYEICPEASLDVDKRLALYRRAEMNFFVNNGPAALAHYSRDIPYRIFFPVAPGYPTNEPGWLKLYMGIDIAGGEQWPWRTPIAQEIILGDDILQNLKLVYRRWRDAQREEAA